MDLAKVPNERKLYLCKWYFKGSGLIISGAGIFIFNFYTILAGLLFLPFVWIVNLVWFFNEAFRKPAYQEQKEIKKCKQLVLELYICYIV